MRKTKLKLIIIGAVVLILALAGALFVAKKPQTNQPTLIMATEAGFKPFDYHQNGQVVGFDVDLAQEIAKDTGRELKIEELSFDGLIPALQAGRVDMIIAGMTVTEDRARNVNFSDPYYEASQMIIVHQDSAISSAEDLRHRKIGVQMGTTGDTMVDDITGAQKLQLPSVPPLFQELNSKRIDAIILDNAPATTYIHNNPKLKILDQKLSTENYAVAVSKDDHELLSQVNKTIDRIKTDGTYDQMMTKYFGDDQTPPQGKMTFSEIFFGDNRYLLLIKGLWVTLALTLMSIILGIILGLVATIMRISKIKPLVFISRLYTTVIRGTPLLVQLLLLYYVVFGSLQIIPKLIIAAIAFGINSGAYIAETLRSGFEALPKGQWESAESLGFNYLQTIYYVTLPQVLRNSLPGLVNELIALIKETSVVGWIGLNDLMRGADNIRFQTATAFESLTAAALIYLLITTILTKVSHRIEQRLDQNDRN